jgi:hypothetical protein
MSDLKKPAKTVQPAELVDFLFKLHKDKEGNEVRTACLYLGKSTYKLTYKCLHESCKHEASVIHNTGKTALKTHFKSAHCGGNEANLYDVLQKAKADKAASNPIGFKIRSESSDRELAMFHWLKYIVENSRPFKTIRNCFKERPYSYSGGSRCLSSPPNP